MQTLKASVITVSFNSAKRIHTTIESVNKQNYPEIEHIFIDGNSTDDTVNAIQTTSIRKSVVVSEPDNGIYDAMNKGFMHSKGDFLAFLNSDDYYADPNVINDVARIFKDKNVDYVYGDIEMINIKGKVVRH